MTLAEFYAGKKVVIYYKINNESNRYYYCILPKEINDDFIVVEEQGTELVLNKRYIHTISEYQEPIHIY